MNLNDIKNFNRDLEAFVANIEAKLNTVIKIEAELRGQLERTYPPTEEAAPSPPTEEVEYEATEAIGNYTIEQYLASNWTMDQLLEKGFVQIVKSEPEAPPAPTEPEAPPAPTEDEIPEIPKIPDLAPETETVEFDGVHYKIAPKAAGAVFQQFYDSGWTKDTLLSEGYLIAVVAEPDIIETPEVPSIPNVAPETVEVRWPRKNDDDDTWSDSQETIFDSVKHGMSKGDIPAVTIKGVFKKKKGYQPPVGESEAPEAPELTSISAPEAPEAPKAPEAPTVTDEPLDVELKDLIETWK